MNEPTEKKLLTPGEILSFIEGLKKIGVHRGRAFGVEFEFSVELPNFEPAVEHLTPEEYEEKAKKIRKELNDEVYAAS